MNKTATQQDRDAQQLVHHGDVTTATQANLDSLSNRIAAGRNGEQMVLFFHVCLRSALIYVGEMTYPTYSLDIVGNAPKLQQCLAPQPNTQVLAATFTTLRGCAVFKAAYASLSTRRIKIQFDDTRTIEVSCALVEAARPAGAPVTPLRLIRCQIGLAYAAKCNTNALFQVLFRVRELRRLLKTEGERSISALNHLNDLDAVRDTAEMQAKQKLLLSRFADCEDNALNVLHILSCKNSMNTSTKTWCALHKGLIRIDSPQTVLKCSDSVNKAIENASNQSETSANRPCVTCGTVTTQTVTTTNEFNSHGILLVQPSPAHGIVADVDEECGDWQLYAGLLPGGRAFFRYDGAFLLYHPRARLPCGLISDSTKTSAEALCQNQTPILLFYLRAVPDAVDDGVQDNDDAQENGVQDPIQRQAPDVDVAPHAAQGAQIAAIQPQIPAPQIPALVQRFQDAHLGRLPFDQIPTTVMVLRQDTGETDVIRTRLHVTRFKTDTMEMIMTHLLAIHGLESHFAGLGNVVFVNAVCKLNDGSDVAIGHGRAHQQYADMVVQLRMNVTREKSL
ncbi:hypothetical protein FN846DRAFT_893975 [Sphaerosporella brunnea]|uniref:Uncharacterized protein n=1 Tax=Sphaerosporella brunnea TaxID=1250544 RepID=A0A5J5EKV1_9PEZI|nr:hypothetical protein FN846DRAFT_893975 [Sphaerosporella brunnea]